MKYADLRRENEALRNALESLVDLQNGPPLISDTAEWELAMWAAYRVLGRPDYVLGRADHTDAKLAPGTHST